jgi:hypothetical protein
MGEEAESESWHNLLAGQALQGGVMAKRYGRPSAQYRYEHYDPTLAGETR